MADKPTPMGPLAGVTPARIVAIVPFNGMARVDSLCLSANAIYATYAQLAAWASEQAQRFERVYPISVSRGDNNMYAVAFGPPVSGGSFGFRSDLTREQAVTIFRDGLPRHEVFPNG